MSICPVCGSSEAVILPSPHPGQSITTSGVLLALPLRKLHCTGCGLLRQSSAILPTKNDLYRESYALYYRRPGTVASETARYTAMAAWIRAAVGDFEPSSVLDVGCGAGLLLGAMRTIWPTAKYAGIEPSIENSSEARSLGFSVTTGLVPELDMPLESHQLVVATNVIQHIAEPVEFLRALSGMAKPKGRIVLLCPDGSEPGADHLWADQEFSFCRSHLIALGAKSGMQEVTSGNTQAPQGMDDKQIVVFERSSSPTPARMLGAPEREALLRRRGDYFMAWQRLATRLDERIGVASSPVLNFGASMWSMLLMAYCPAYWAHVEACIVDGADGHFLEKPVIRTDRLAAHPRPLVVLGTNPASHDALARRLSALGEIVIWNDLIER